MKATAKVSQEAVDTLELHPENPRIGLVPSIVDSIRENGWFGTLLGQKSTRYILAGNHRLLAARELGIKSVPVVWLDVSDGRARKIMLADNRASDLATYDDDALAALLREVIADVDVNALMGTGWTEYDLERLAPPPPPEGWDKYDEATDDTKKRTVVCPECSHSFNV